MRPFLPLAALVIPCATLRSAPQSSFVNWETPHVHPLERTPDGALLLAVNTADARLEAWAIQASSTAPLAPAFSVPVGIDPCSVRARTATEAWVVNNISDTISIVDLATRNVVRTLSTDDEPFDVVFAGGKAFVSCGAPDTVLVWSLANLAAAPTRIPILGEEPRALSVSPDGTKVWAAVFESGNSSTILGGGSTMGNGGFPPNVVSDTQGPYGGQNPPPNNGTLFSPAINPALPTPIRVGLIVKKDAAGAWRDDNGRNWTNRGDWGHWSNWLHWSNWSNWPNWSNGPNWRHWGRRTTNEFCNCAIISFFWRPMV